MSELKPLCKFVQNVTMAAREILTSRRERGGTALINALGFVFDINGVFADMRGIMYTRGVTVTIFPPKRFRTLEFFF